MADSTSLPFPPIYLLPTHISIEELHDLEVQIPTLTQDISESKLILGRVKSKLRAKISLRERGLFTEDIDASRQQTQVLKLEGQKADDSSSAKREGGSLKRAGSQLSSQNKKPKVQVISSTREVIDLGSSTDSGDEAPRPRPRTPARSPSQTSTLSASSRASSVVQSLSSPNSQSSRKASTSEKPDTSKSRIEEWSDTVKIVRLEWFSDSVNSKALLPIAPYLIYEGRRTQPAAKGVQQNDDAKAALARARADAPKTVALPFTGYSKQGGRNGVLPQSSGGQGHKSMTRPTHLLHQTTSEHDNPSKFPPLPSFLQDKFSCTRSTPLTGPNDEFIDLLKVIRLHRILTLDEIGVRAYSTAIASIAAYPHAITSPFELSRLPGCENKIAALFDEYRESLTLQVVKDIEASSDFKILKEFWQIWGCGAKTANDFLSKGYRDLDDVVQYEWKNLQRVQQIGVKYYDEFLEPIPRAEVEAIADIILQHTHAIDWSQGGENSQVSNGSGAGWQLCIVGGYRRGKTSSGDVDVVLTHPDESVTRGAIDAIVRALEDSEWIMHTLSMTHANTERGQMPVAWHGDAPKTHGSGFDTLDKALVVWQDPIWPTKTADTQKARIEGTKLRNPNIHRRVDIIISPWKTAGCAISGWTSGTTFNRDMRLWAKEKKNMKFDSSGIRSHEDGSWVDLEGQGEETLDLLEKEKRVFRGLGLEWREPTMRCTG